MASPGRTRHRPEAGDLCLCSSFSQISGLNSFMSLKELSTENRLVVKVCVLQSGHRAPLSHLGPQEASCPHRHCPSSERRSSQDGALEETGVRGKQRNLGAGEERPQAHWSEPRLSSGLLLRAGGHPGPCALQFSGAAFPVKAASTCMVISFCPTAQARVDPSSVAWEKLPAWRPAKLLRCCVWDQHFRAGRGKAGV